MIVSISPSKVKHKRFAMIMDTGKKYNFGLDTGSAYIDHHDKQIREAYRARHYGDGIERKLIDNLVPSPSLFSWYILWGPYKNFLKKKKKRSSCKCIMEKHT